jgi:hypothetical protein
MNIHINKGGNQKGPFNIKQANQQLGQGSLLPTDAAWHEGLHGWIPLKDVDGIILPNQSLPPQFEPDAFGESIGTPDSEQSSLAKLANDLKVLASGNDKKSMMDRWCGFLFPGPK